MSVRPTYPEPQSAQIAIAKPGRMPPEINYLEPISGFSVRKSSLIPVKNSKMSLTRTEPPRSRLQLPVEPLGIFISRMHLGDIARVEAFRSSSAEIGLS